jgi:hypothetical protein
MRFWSKGLGERELVIDLSRGNLTREEGKVCMRGIIVEPVAWNYEVTLFPEDVRGILRVMLSPQALLYFFKNIPGVVTFFVRLVKRDYGFKPAEAKPGEKKPEEKKPAEAKAGHGAAS